MPGGWHTSYPAGGQSENLWCLTCGNKKCVSLDVYDDMILNDIGDPECKTEYAKRPFKQKGQEDDFFSFFLQ